MISLIVARTSQQLLQSNLKIHHLNIHSCGNKLRNIQHNLRLAFYSRAMADDLTKELDDTQVKLLSEECLLVNKDDAVIGSASKKECHLMENIKKGMLHRAFSVFLFNSNGELLLQQRANAKITFPGYWANTCCSHPLNVPGETEEGDAMGVKRAAQRKLKHELGIEAKQVPLEEFHYITRIHYQAPCDNPVWGEHEIDYILFLQKDVDVKPEPNEVQNYMYCNPQQVKELLEKASQEQEKVSPWFELIARNMLDGWWAKLEALDSIKNQESITRL